MLKEQVHLAVAAVKARDLEAALKALYLPSWAPLVWPDAYEKAYWYQEVSGTPQGYPVEMRSTWNCLLRRYGKAQLQRKLFERMLRIYRVTEVEHPARDTFQDFASRFEQKHGNVRLSGDHTDYIVSLRHAVIVRGKIIPMDRERIAAIEKAVAVIEKLDKLAA